MLHRPLAWSAVGLATGVLAAVIELPADRLCWLSAVMLCGSAVLLPTATITGTLRLSAILLFAGFAFTGRLAVTLDEHPGPEALVTQIERYPGLFSEGVDLTGRVSRPPDACPERYPQAPCQDLLVEVSQVRLSRIRHTVAGRARLRLPGRGEDPPLARGDRIEAFAQLWIPSRYGNEGAFDPARYLHARGIEALGSIKSRRLLSRAGFHDPSLRTSVMRRVDLLRSSLLYRIDRAFPRTARGQRARAVARALLLGDRRDLDQTAGDSLQRAGVSHLLAVSGFNVAVLAAALFFLVRSLGLSTRAAAALVIPVLLLYMLVNRDESSVVRAVTMAVTWLAGCLIWRRPDPYNTAGLAALVILVPAPTQIHDPGFQLTFMATLPLILIHRRSPARDGKAVPAGARRPALLRWLAGALIVTVAATAGTLPLTVLHFNRVTPGGILANLVAGPLMAFAFITVLFLEVVSLVSNTWSELAAGLVIALVDASFWIAQVVGQVPLLSYRRITPGPALVAVYYAGLLAWTSFRSRRRWPAPTASLITGAAAAILLLPLDTRSEPKGLRVTVLDVGQGDSILLESPGGDRVLVDAGAAYAAGSDVGERVVSGALWDMGVASLDLLIVTHGDADHAGGAASVIRNFKPREVWVPPGADRWHGTWVASRFEAALEDTGIQKRDVARGAARCLRGARLAVLHPPSPTSIPEGNERSIVLRWSGGGRAALLMGDAGTLTESRLGPDEVRASLLKVGHHGSRTATSPGFLRRVSPEVAVISCGRRNRFGHPHEDVLSRLRESETRVCRTDRHGAVEIELLPEATLLDPSCPLSRRRESFKSPSEKAGG